MDGPHGPITLRFYAPVERTELAPAFLWCHGGGFVVGDLDANDPICRNVARSSKAIVVAVGYRLAPEHDLYAGRDDFLAALNWIAEHGASMGIDTTRLAIGGDSAGGNIAAAVAQENLRRRGPTIRLQVLAYPATELFAEFDSKRENARGYFLTARAIDSLKPLVVQGKDIKDPWLSPALNPDMQGLPPALIVTAGFDPIRDDGLGYAARLRAAGVPVELLHYPGQFHGFLNFDTVIAAARDALTRVSTSLSRAHRGEEPADCSIEISDRAVGSSLLALPIEVLTAGLLVGRTARQLSGATVRWVSPGAAQVATICLSPVWVPLALMRRALTAYLNKPVSRQTFP
jgi:acetyl esterase